MTDRPPFGPDQIAALKLRLDRPIVLLGLMGVGKSTVGQRLAHLLEIDFVDSDTAIEEAAQRSISEIFAQFGEPAFRDGERRVIARLMAEKQGVIATGGGAFVDPETRKLVLEQGIAVWLDCNIDTLAGRVSRKSTRPLLVGKDPHAVLADLHRKRAPAYGEAPIRVQSGDVPHHETALRILEAIDQWL